MCTLTASKKLVQADCSTHGLLFELQSNDDKTNQWIKINHDNLTEKMKFKIVKKGNGRKELASERLCDIGYRQEHGRIVKEVQEEEWPQNTVMKQGVWYFYEWNIGYWAEEGGRGMYDKQLR